MRSRAAAHEGWMSGSMGSSFFWKEGLYSFLEKDWVLLKGFLDLGSTSILVYLLLLNSFLNFFYFLSSCSFRSSSSISYLLISINCFNSFYKLSSPPSFCSFSWFSCYCYYNSYLDIIVLFFIFFFLSLFLPIFF